MKSSSPLALPLSALLVAWCAVSGAGANYRHFHLNNADICQTAKLGEDSKPLVIGSGAAIIQLATPSSKFQPDYNRAKRCQIHIKSPDKDHGLMAYVEEMHMRRSSKDSNHCIDYLQFGRNDRIPFITLKKSDKYCGEWDGRRAVSHGISYDDPGGDLLVWVSLGGRRQSSWWPGISVVNLTLVVTTYQKECQRPKQNYRRCADRTRCVYKNYFCDQHFNCLTDKIPLDEDGCTYEEPESADEDSSGTGGGSGSGSTAEGSGLNSVTKTLVIVCSTLGLLLLLILWLRCRKSKKECCGAGGAGGDDNCEDDVGRNRMGGPRSLEELNRLREQRNRPAAEENLYLPASAGRGASRAATAEGTSFIVDPSVGVVESHMSVPSAGLGRASSSGAGPGRNRPPSEEPPPAYDDLFPGSEPPGSGGGGRDEPQPPSTAEA